MDKQIIITDVDVLNFFNENNLLDRNRFIAYLVKNYKEKKEEDISEKIELTKNEIFTLYKEHKNFLDHKKTLLNLTRDFHKNIQANINSLKFQEINEFYSKHLELTSQPSFTCDICNTFCVTTKKGMSAHQRKCRKLLNVVDDISSIDDTSR